MEITFKNYKYHKDIINTTIYPSTIIGITGPNYKEFLNIFNIINKHTEIKIDGNRLTTKDVDYYKNKIVYIDNINYLETNKTVYDYLLSIINLYDIKVLNEYNKIMNALTILGLNIDLNTNINDLTTSEKTLLTISTELLFNGEILILNEPYLGLDKINIKLVNIILNKLKDDYQKTIILASNNSNELYNYTEYMYFINGNKLQKEGQTEELYENITFLEKYNYEIPNSIKFISTIKDKGIKIDYKKDIRDIIKDIYKSVR